MGRTAFTTMLLLAIAAGCADDEPSTAAAPPPSTPPSSTLPTTTLPTTTLPATTLSPTTTLPTIDPADWLLRDAGRPVVVEDVDGGTDDDGGDTALAYGGGTWRGTLEVEQYWTQLGRTEDSSTIDLALSIASDEIEARQWLDAQLTHAVVDTPDAFFEGVAPTTPTPVVVDPTGRRQHAVATTGDRHADDGVRRLVDDVLTLVLPTLPETPLSVGAGWSVRDESEQPGAGDRYTLTALDDPIATFALTGPAGAYFGDRYDGYWVDAEWSGTITVDLAAAVPLAADLRADGTIGFSVAGERDGMETREWVHRLVLRTVPVDSSDG